MDVAARERAYEINAKLKGLFQRYGVANVPAAVVAEMKALTNELEGLVGGDELAKIKGTFDRIDHGFNTPANPIRHPGRSSGNGGGNGDGTLSAALSGKALGDAFVESKAFRDFDGHAGPVAEIEIKTLLDTATWAPESARLPRIEPYPAAPLAVADLLGQGETSQAAVPYMEETTYDNAAAEQAEGEAKGEAELAFTERSSPVRTVAVFLPVTRQLMDDVAAARSYVGSRLGFMVRSRLDGQLLNGDGVAPNVTGILNTAGIQTQAKGVDPVPDAIQKAMTLLEVNAFYEADTVILHPNDWRDIRLLRTSDGQYIFGAPGEATPPNMWGKSVVSTTRIAEGTGLVGAFRSAATLFYRSALEIAVSDSHSDYFVKNKLAIRAEIRVALACFRPAAFATVTGI